MKRLSLVVTLVFAAGCAAPEFAPDAVVSSAGGHEIAVRSWEFCGPAGGSYECLDSLPSDDLPVLTVPQNETWTIERPDGYSWDITYTTSEPNEPSPVIFLGDRDGNRITEIPQLRLINCQCGTPASSSGH